MGQKVSGYRRNVPYGEASVRVNLPVHRSKTQAGQERSWRFEVNPKGRVGWNRGTVGRTEKAYGETLSESGWLRKELEEVRKGFGCESNGLGRKGTKETGYQVYGEYTYPDRVNPRGKVEAESTKEEGEGKNEEKPVKGRKKKVNLRKPYSEKDLRIGRERVRRKYEKWRGAKIERSRTNLKERRKDKGLEGEKKERKLVLGYTSKRVKGGERGEAVALSGVIPTGKRRTKLIVRELEHGLNHMEVRRNVENRRTHHAKSSQYGRKKAGEGRKGKGEKYGYYGYQVRVKGPLGGGRRTLSYVIQNGTVPRGSKKARRLTDFEHGKTKIGTIGVKVTYCYGRG